MRITFLTHDSGLYGANRSLLDLIDGLRTYGAVASVIAPRDGEIAEELQKRDTAFRACDLGRWASLVPKAYDGRHVVRRVGRRVRSTVDHLKESTVALPLLVRQLRAWHTDVVYSNSSLVVSGALAARYLGVPHVWHLREFGDLDYRLVPDLGRTAQKWLINRADGVIAISESVREHYQLNSASRIRVVYSGVAWEADFDRLREEAEHNVNRHGPYTFALVGLLHPAKGQETAIRALYDVVQRRRDVKLILAGSGRLAYWHELERLVERLGLDDHVEFRGYTGDIFSIYQNADAVLMCSTNEAMGRVTAEAMATSRPVIGYSNAGTKEIVEHEKTGLLYEGGSEALADCMLRFLEKPGWARTLGENGWHRARDRFTIERYAASVFEVLRELPGINNLMRTDWKSISPKVNGVDSQPSISYSKNDLRSHSST